MNNTNYYIDFSDCYDSDLCEHCVTIIKHKSDAPIKKMMHGVFILKLIMKEQIYVTYS